MTKELKPWVYTFLDAYLADPANNQTKAMLRAKPYLKYGSANTTAIRLLQNATVKRELEKLRCERYAASVSRKSNLILIAGKIAEDEDAKPAVRLKAVDQVAKLAHLYNKEESDEEKFNKFIQGLKKAKDVKVIESNTSPDAQKYTPAIDDTTSSDTLTIDAQGIVS